jgi:hypothetical protein
MVNSFAVNQNDFISVVVSDPSAVSVVVPDPAPFQFVGVLGAQGPAGPRGPGGSAVSEVVSGQLQNGVATTFSLANTVDTSQAVQVYRNGLMEVPGVGFSATSNSIIFTTPPLSSDVVAVVYQKVAS